MSTRYTPVTELFYAGEWHDISADVFNKRKVRITRGTQNEGGEPDAATCTLMINNGASLVAPGVVGRYSRRNPRSDLFGVIGRRVPVRVTVPQLTSAPVRFVGDVLEWPAQWDLTASVRWVEVTAYGLRHTVSAAPLQSALRRAIPATGPAGYWPLEDPAGAPLARSPIPGCPPARPFGYSRFEAPFTGEPLPPAGLPEFGTGDVGPGSAPVVDLSRGGTLRGLVPQPAGESGWRVEWVMTQPRDQADSRTPIWWETTDAFTDHPSEETMRYEANVAASGMTIFYGRMSTSYGSGWSAFTIADGLPHHYRVDGDQDGGTIRIRVWVDGLLAATVASFSDTLAGTVGQVTEWVLNPRERENGDDLMPSLGHVAIWSPVPGTSDTVSAATGHAGETAGDRFERLCAEESVPGYTLIGDAASSAPMGPQRRLSVLELLQECADADDAILTEARGTRALVMRLRSTLYNQTPLVLAHGSGRLAAPLTPVDDDKLIVNDVTLRTPAGDETRIVQEEGALNVQDPTDDPDGVGRMPVELDRNVADAAELESAAWWMLSAGTIDETRFPQIPVDLTSQAWDDTARDAAAAVDVGDLVQLRGLDAFGLPPDPVEQIVEGYAEEFDLSSLRITWSTSPGALYRVGVLASTTRTGTRGSVTTADVDAGVDTALPVARAAGNRSLWTVRPADFPMELLVSGVRLTATSCAQAGPVNPNGTFEVDASGWSGTGGTVGRSTAQAHTGSASLLLTPDGVSAEAIAATDVIPVHALDGAYPWTWSAWVRCASTRVIDMQILWYDDGGGLLGTTTVTAGVIADTWTQLGATSSPPASAARVSGRVRLTGTPTSGVLTYIDDAELSEPGRQTFTIAATPVNGVEKTILAGSPVRPVAPWRLAR
ncbi:hypothetical protein EDC02_6347 [Micromonospora sp. Llam0]|uniref:hypothetical protein n=1 Tax=Micromonospora sp. Llam0 TaxID=2485143 RepID=UPI000F4A0747|nr:hypothetical protein [Micromonospora sp. Llam0]ROO51469.1 hypothetical protein EDC02_6347 [Micromonospora sp. Llam0]